jgi:hypothetical protein
MQKAALILRPLQSTASLPPERAWRI